MFEGIKQVEQITKVPIREDTCAQTHHVYRGIFKIGKDQNISENSFDMEEHSGTTTPSPTYALERHAKTNITEYFHGLDLPSTSTTPDYRRMTQHTPRTAQTAFLSDSQLLDIENERLYGYPQFYDSVKEDSPVIVISDDEDKGDNPEVIVISSDDDDDDKKTDTDVAELHSSWMDDSCVMATPRATSTPKRKRETSSEDSSPSLKLSDMEHDSPTILVAPPKKKTKATKPPVKRLFRRRKSLRFIWEYSTDEETQF